MDLLGIGSVAAGIGSVADTAKSIMKMFVSEKMGDAEKAQAEIQLQELLSSRDNALIESQKAIMVAELNQGDNFTKRARPMVIYAGLVFIFLVHVFLPIVSDLLGRELSKLTLPEEFWWAWTGICTAWVIGRSAEKGGARNKLVGMVTGNKGL